MSQQVICYQSPSTTAHRARLRLNCFYFQPQEDLCIRILLRPRRRRSRLQLLPLFRHMSKNMSVLLPTSHGNHAYANHNLPGSTSPSSSAGSLDILDWLEPGRHPILPAPIPDTGPRGLYSADYRAAYTWSTTNRCEKPHLFYRVHPKPASPLLHGY